MRALRARRFLTSAEGGVTLIELMVALILFGFISAAVATGLGSSYNLVRNNRNRSVAAHVASAEMDSIRSQSVSSLPLGQVTSTTTVQQTDYTVRRDTNWVIRDAATDPCDSPSGARLAYLRITVRVTWPNMGSIPPVRSQTIMTPSAAAFDPTAGHVGVKVLSAGAVGGQGHLVTVQPLDAGGSPSGPASTLTTTTEGCAFFAYLDPGSYGVSLSTTGFVDAQGDPAPQQTVGVSAGQVTSVAFDYDQASGLLLTLGDTDFPVPGNFPVSIGNSTLIPLGVKSFIGAGSSRSITGLFPFTDQYRVWIGDCLENDPSGNAFSLVPITPGTTTAVDVVAARVLLHVSDATATPVSGATVRVSQAADPPPGSCGGTSLLPAGTTDVGGDARFSLPYGTWDFEVSDGTTTIVQTVMLVPSDDPANPSTPVSVTI